MEAKSITSRRQRRDERGFSLVELLTVGAILVIVSAIAILKMQPTLQEYQANAALDQVKGTLRQARELAISQRRVIQVSIQNDIQGYMSIRLTQVSVGGVAAAAPFLSIPIESTMQVMTFGGELDTPDGFGIPLGGANGSGVEFGGVSGGPVIGFFQEDGSFTNAAVGPVNGTIFLTPANMAANNIRSGVRAVTVFGTTGRIRSYHYTGFGWRQIE